MQVVIERISDFETRIDSPGFGDFLGTVIYSVVIILLAEWDWEFSRLHLPRTLGRWTWIVVMMISTDFAELRLTHPMPPKKRNRSPMNSTSAGAILNRLTYWATVAAAAEVTTNPR